MNEVVKYHNDLNKIKIPNGELEQNLLFGILSKMRDKKCEIIEFIPQELNEFAKSNLSNRELFKICFNLRSSFFRLNFDEYIETQLPNNVIEVRIKTAHLFNEFEIAYETENDTSKAIFKKLTMQVNPRFTHIVNELIGNFTRFELAEFTALSGKYTKTLYRLLKQYRSTGYFYMEWNEFARIMDIPSNYNQSNINAWILKPSVKELTAELNLLDQIGDNKRIPFEELTYKKIKGKGRGRGGNVVGIEFHFKPQLQEPKKESTIPQLESSPKKDIELGEYKYKIARVKGKETEFTILEVIATNEKIIVSCSDNCDRIYKDLDDLNANIEILGDHFE